MEILIYFFKVSACTALFFGFYIIVLRKLSFFKINRFYLLATLLLSFVIPAIQINIEKEAKAIAKQAPIVLYGTQNTAILEENRAETLSIHAVETRFDWSIIIAYIYFSVASILMFIYLWQLFRLIRFAQGYTNYQGLKLISKTEGFTNCSFFNYVFINMTSLSETDLKVLLRHEQVHSNQYHSIDKIFLMMVKTILWFNPIIYLFDKALEQTHEYEADQSTAQNFGNKAYANLLLRLAVSKSNTVLIHNFVKNPIKDRIKMLFNAKSSSMKRLVYFLALPIGLGLVWLFSVQMVYVDAKGKPDLVFKAKQSATKEDQIKVKNNFLKSAEIKKKVTKSLNERDTIKLNKIISPKIISSTKITGNVKEKIVYIEDAVIEILGSKLTAKSIEWDRENNLLTAYKANNFNDSHGLISEKIIFDLKTGTYKTFDSSSDATKKTYGDYNLNQKKLFVESVQYSASDSVKFSKDKSIIYLYGKAKLYLKGMVLDAEEITFNNINSTGKAKNLQLTSESGTKIKGSSASFDLNGKVEIWQNSDGKLTVEP